MRSRPVQHMLNLRWTKPLKTSFYLKSSNLITTLLNTCSL